MDASLPVAQALAVKDGRIVEVGGTDEVLWLREDDYEVIDLAGRTVVPGFVDPHNHFSIGAFETLWADCRAARSVADLQQTLAAAASDTPAGAWVRGVGYDHHLIGAHPTRGDLDAAVPDRPALVMHFSHHQAVANSRALAEAGIARGTPDPIGGEIARDKAGEPTGLLFERALSRAETASREAWETRFVEVARAASRRYAALGITAIQDAAVTPAMARRYADARAAAGSSSSHPSCGTGAGRRTRRHSIRPSSSARSPARRAPACSRRSRRTSPAARTRRSWVSRPRSRARAAMATSRRPTRRCPSRKHSRPTRSALRAPRASTRSPGVSNPGSARICSSCRRTRSRARRRSCRRSGFSRRG